MRGQRSDIRKIDIIWTLHKHISKIINRDDIKLSPACFPFISERNKVWYRLVMKYLWRIASRKGTASPSSAKSNEGKLGQWTWLPQDSVKRHFKHVYVKKYQSGIRSQDLKKLQNTAKLATIGMYGVSQGQWPWMTFERSRRNVEGQMLSCAELIHAQYLHYC